MKLTTGSKVFLPIGYGGTFDVTSTSSNIEYCGFVSPCDGYLDYVIIRSEYAHGSTIVGLHKASDGTEAPSYSASNSTTVSMSSDDTPYKFSGGSSWSFVAGQVLSISMDPTSYSTSEGDVMATVVFILDWNNEDISASGGGSGGGSG